MADNYTSWNEFEEVKNFINSKMGQQGCEIQNKWEILDGTMIDTVDFVWNGTKYRIFLSCRNQRKLGFGISSRDNGQVISNDNITYENFNQDISQHLDQRSL
jgi:hypothetical protein